MADERSGTWRRSKPKSVPCAPPGATIAVTERSIIRGISHRCDTSDRAAATVNRACFCSRCPPVRANGGTRQPFIGRQRHLISRNGASCCR
jgi:hypothetical protein